MTTTRGQSIRHPCSVDVADMIRGGYSVGEALHAVLSSIQLDGSGPHTTTVLADLEDMGLWHPAPIEGGRNDYP